VSEELGHAPTNDREEAMWYEAEFKRASRIAANLAEEKRQLEKNARELVAALVELAGGEVRVPRRLMVDPPDLLVEDDHDLDGWRIYRTRRAP
jgi:hypothetical protein